MTPEEPGPRVEFGAPEPLSLDDAGAALTRLWDAYTAIDEGLVEGEERERLEAEARELYDEITRRHHAEGRARGADAESEQGEDDGNEDDSDS